MRKGKRRKEGMELSGIYSKKEPSQVYPNQESTYCCNSCATEVRFQQATCHNCGEQFDWAKTILVRPQDYDADAQRELREARKRFSRKRER